MEERWRKPPEIAAVEHDAQNMVVLGERRALDMSVTVADETFERMRLGYVCAKCYEPHEVPFPKVCAMPGCGFPMRDQQLEQLASDYQGSRWLGPQQSLADEIEGLDERLASSRIVLPPGVRGA